jgi:Protein of unknown function (DUF1254)
MSPASGEDGPASCCECRGMGGSAERVAHGFTPAHVDLSRACGVAAQLASANYVEALDRVVYYRGRWAVTPNNGTFYGAGFADLSSEAMVIQTPTEVPERLPDNPDLRRSGQHRAAPRVGIAHSGWKVPARRSHMGRCQTRRLPGHIAATDERGRGVSPQLRRPLGSAAGTGPARMYPFNEDRPGNGPSVRGPRFACGVPTPWRAGPGAAP